MQTKYHPKGIHRYLSAILWLTVDVAFLIWCIILMIQSESLDLTTFWKVFFLILCVLDLLDIVRAIRNIKRGKSDLPTIVITDDSILIDGSIDGINTPLDAVDWEAVDLTRPKVEIYQKGKHWADSISIKMKRYESDLAEALGRLKAEHSIEA